MKILVIANLYPSRKDPYYGTFVKNFVDEFVKRTSPLSVNTCLIKGRSSLLIEKIFKYTIFYVEIIFKLLFSHYDLVYVHVITHAAPPLRLISIFKKIPLCFNIHGEDLLSRNRLEIFFLSLVTPLLESSKLIVVPSMFFKKKVSELLPKIDEQKVFISHSGGVKDFFYKDYDVRQTNNVVGYVSRIDEGKGWDVLLKAIKLLQSRGVNVSCVLAGRGAKEKEMLSMIEKLSVENVKYIGPIEYEKLPTVYQSFDVFVFPTVLEESLGLVGVEAMACHVPVIGSDIGGLKDYIEDGNNGFLFSPGNEFELSKKIEFFFNLSEEKKKRMRNNAYLMALNFEEKVVSDNLFQQIEKLVETK